MTDIQQKLMEQNPDDDLCFINDCDPAIIGVTSISSHVTVAYDIDKMIKCIGESNGWNHADSEEWFWANIESMGVGENTPIFVEAFVNE